MPLNIMPSTNSAINLLNAGKYPEAAAICKQILDVDPNEMVALQVMALCLTRVRRLSDAKILLDRILKMQPMHVPFMVNFAVALAEVGEWKEIDTICKKILAIDPKNLGGLNLLGCATRQENKLAESAEIFKRAVEANPKFEEAMTNLGTTLWMMGDLEEAKKVLDECMRIHPKRGAAELAYGAILLEQGQWTKGWEMYESRWTSKEAKPRRHATHPRWTGQDLAGKRILIYGEQGLGDSLQFVRYAALLKERGAWVSVEAEPAVVSLLARSPGVDEAHGFGAPAPAFDYQAAMLDLPGPLGTTVENVPAKVPYLWALPERVAAWKQRLAKDPAGLRVGVVWAGNPANSRDNLRSIPLKELASWGTVPGVTWYSLQIGHGRSERIAHGWNMIDLAEDISSFEESAAIVTALDLVVTVDTAMAHVAGALGRPVWVVLPRWGDWRWMQGTTDTPWYPTMRLFRSIKLPEWDVPIELVRKALAEKAALEACPARIP